MQRTPKPRKVSHTALFAIDPQGSLLARSHAGQLDSFAYCPYGYCPTSDFMGFNGEFPDPLTGHYLLGNGYRAFNPVLMRFNSPDSLSPFGAGGLNAYMYCVGDPVNSMDPSGHITSPKAFLKWFKPRPMPKLAPKSTGFKLDRIFEEAQTLSFSPLGEMRSPRTPGKAPYNANAYNLLTFRKKGPGTRITQGLKEPYPSWSGRLMDYFHDGVTVKQLERHIYLWRLSQQLPKLDEKVKVFATVSASAKKADDGLGDLKAVSDIRKGQRLKERQFRNHVIYGPVTGLNRP